MEDQTKQLRVLLRKGVETRAQIVALLHPRDAGLTSLIFRRAIFRRRTRQVQRAAPIVRAVVVKKRRNRQDQDVENAMNADQPADIFAERLKKARELRALSQTQLAANAALPPSSVSHFEAGARKPSMDNLKRLAVALNQEQKLVGRVDHDGAGAFPAMIINQLLLEFRIERPLLGLARIFRPAQPLLRFELRVQRTLRLVGWLLLIAGLLLIALTL